MVGDQQIVRLQAFAPFEQVAFRLRGRVAHEEKCFPFKAQADNGAGAVFLLII